MGLLFDCHEDTERNKVKLAVSAYPEYVIVWWEQMCFNRKGEGEPMVDSWAFFEEFDEG